MLPDADDEHQNDGRQQAWQRNVPDLLHARCAVHVRRFKALLIKACNGSEVNDGAPADLLPRVCNDEDATELATVHQKADRLEPKRRDNGVNDARRAEERNENAVGDDPGKEVRQINDELQALLEFRAAHFV